MEKYDIILLLGSRLHDDGTPDLNVLARVRMAAELWKKGVAPVIVTSGFRGFNSEHHNTTQADVMAEFLIQFGIPEECIIRENKSETTWENIQNTKKLLNKEHFTAAVATSDTHMRRSLYMCKLQGVRAAGFAAILPHTKQWRARRRLERLLRLETYVGWGDGKYPEWYIPVSNFLKKRDKRISNEAFEIYNAAIRKAGLADAKKDSVVNESAL